MALAKGSANSIHTPRDSWAMLKPARWLVLFLFALAVGGALAARNSSGTYSLPNSPFVSGTTISSSVMNGNFSDISTELTNSLDRQGRGAMQAPLPLADGSNTSPALTFASQTGAGLYRAGASDIRMTFGGASYIQQWTGSGTSIAGGLSCSSVSSVGGTFSGGVTAASLTTSGLIYSSGSGFKFPDASTLTTAANTSISNTGATIGSNVAAFGSGTGLFLSKTPFGTVSGTITIKATGTIATSGGFTTPLVSFTTSWAFPLAVVGWYGSAVKQSGSTFTVVPAAIDHGGGSLEVGASLATGDIVYVSPAYPGS